MIYVFTDSTTEYQSFPEPDGSRPYVVVTGNAATRIRNGERWKLNSAKTAVEFLSQSQIDAERIPALKADLKHQVNALRDQHIGAGMVYTFPDGTGTIQLRNATDLRNVQGVASAGQALAAIGDTTAKLKFRDAENVSHELTGTQAMTMGLAVSSFITAYYEAAWLHKDAIDSLTSVTSLQQYDPAAGWTA